MAYVTGEPIIMGGNPFDEHDFSHIWKDDEETREIIKKSNKETKNMSKDLTGMSKQLMDALDTEKAFKAYIRYKEDYCRKYGVKIAYPSSEVERLQLLINSDDKPLTNTKKTPKTKTSTFSDSDLLI